MHDFFVSFFAEIPHELATLLIATLPIAELRASIPIALGVYKMSVLSAYIWSVFGNMIPAVLLIYFLQPVSEFLINRSRLCKKLFNWIFARTHNKFRGKFKKYGAFGLVLFVAIPLPVTGAWTGSIASFLFEIPKKQAVALIFAGVIISGIIVTLISKGAFHFL